MPTKTARAFTLIELLVVIAIIGLLSSVVLASLNTAREKGTSASIQDNLKTIQTEGELYFSAHNEYGAPNGQASGSIGSIDSSGTITNINPGSVFTPSLFTGDSVIINALQQSAGQAQTYFGAKGYADISSAGKNYAVLLWLPGTNTLWCVDSRGYAGAVPSNGAVMGYGACHCSTGGTACY